MVSIKLVDKPSMGCCWEVRLSEQELGVVCCLECKKPVELGDEVYVCEVCRKMRHCSHVKGYRKCERLCSHPLQEYVDYKCVVVKE